LRPSGPLRGTARCGGSIAGLLFAKQVALGRS
jgi:hypothetical protein